MLGMVSMVETVVGALRSSRMAAGSAVSLVVFEVLVARGKGR